MQEKMLQLENLSLKGRWGKVFINRRCWIVSRQIKLFLSTTASQILQCNEVDDVANKFSD
jgi:hypothetical protein